MYLLQYFHLFLTLVFILYCQTRTLANGRSNNSKLKTVHKAAPQIKVKNVTTSVSKPKELLKTESSERSYMRAYGTKYELPIILQTGKSVPAKTSENTMKIIVNLTRHRFHHDGQDIFNRPPDGDFNGHNNNNNNFNGFNTVKKFDDSKRMAPESLQNAIGR